MKEYHKIGEVYTAENGIFADLQKDNAKKYETIFGNLSPQILDAEFIMTCGNRSIMYNVDWRDFMASMIWANYYHAWETLVTTTVDVTNNIDYTISTNGTNKQTETRKSTQGTNSDVYAFGDDEPADLKDTDQTTDSNSTIDTNNINTVTYKGRNGGDRIGDYKALYNFQHATAQNIINDIVDYISIPVYM